MAKFKPGVSGNPSGRPKGIKSPSARLRQLIADDVPEILAVLRQKALDGDSQAAGLLLSRCLPPLRPESPAVEVTVKGDTLGERAEAVVHSVFVGDLSPSAATELMTALSAQARVLEIAELERRLAALEKVNHGK